MSIQVGWLKVDFIFHKSVALHLNKHKSAKMHVNLIILHAGINKLHILLVEIIISCKNTGKRLIESITPEAS